MSLSHFSSGNQSISFPESSFPLTSSRKTRALGATISGMCHRCKLYSETRRAEFGYFLCYFKMVAPRALVFRPLVKRNEDSGNEIGNQTEHCLINAVFCVKPIRIRYRFGTLVPWGWKDGRSCEQGCRNLSWWIPFTPTLPLPLHLSQFLFDLFSHR